MRLWKTIHGEPFMVNPVLGILGTNPARKKGRKTMAKRHGARHMAWVRSFRKNRSHRRRRARRNPYAMAGPIAALNPRRRHRRARRNPVRHHRRRNPVRLFNLPPLTAVVYAGAGFAGTAYLEGFASGFVPAEWTGSTLGRYAVKIGSAIGVTWLSKLVFGRQASYLVGIGSGVYVAVSAVKDFAPGVIPGLSGPLNLSAYRQMRGPLNLSAYRTGHGVKGYQTAHANLGAPAFGAANTSRTTGATNVVAARFRRFQ